MDAPTLDEQGIRAKLAAKGKYSPEQIESFIQKVRTTPQTGTGITQTSVPTNAVADAGKSFWNGAIPLLLKGVTEIPKIAVDATDNHSDTLDKWTKTATDAIDQNLSFDIPQEYQQGLLHDPRSFANNIGSTLGMIGAAVGIGYLTGGAGESVLGAEGGALTAEEALAAKEAAQGSMQARQKLGNMMAFTAQMLDPLYKAGKAAGLDDKTNARMVSLLAPVMGATALAPGLVSSGMKIFSKEAPAVITEGLETELKQLAGKEVSPEMFKEVAKKATSSMMGKIKGLATSNFVKEGAADATNMAFLNAIEEGGKQVYDTYYAPEGATVGKGKYGADLQKKVVSPDFLSNAFLGGLLGSGMSLLHTSPVIDQALFGYIDTNTKSGKAPKAIERLNQVLAKMQQQGKMSPDEVAQAQSKIERISKITADYQNLTGMTPDAKYSAYDYQYNIKPPIQEIVTAHDALVQEHERLLAEPNSDKLVLGNIAKQIEDGEPLYKTATEQIGIIDGYVDRLGKTGEIENIEPQLAEVLLKNSPKVQEEMAKQPVEKNWDEVLGEEKKRYDSLSDEDIVSTINDYQQHGAELYGNDIEYLTKLAAEKNIELPKTETDATIQKSSAGTLGTHEGGNQEIGGQEEGEGVGQGEQGQEVAAESQTAPVEHLKSAIESDYRGLLDRMYEDGIIHKVDC